MREMRKNLDRRMVVGRYKDLFREQPGTVLKKLDEMEGKRAITSNEYKAGESGSDLQELQLDAVLELPEECVSEASTQTDPEPETKRQKTFSKEETIDMFMMSDDDSEADNGEQSQKSEKSQDSSQASQDSQMSEIRDAALIAMSSMTDDDFNRLER